MSDLRHAFFAQELPPESVSTDCEWSDGHSDEVGAACETDADEAQAEAQAQAETEAGSGDRVLRQQRTQVVDEAGGACGNGHLKSQGFESNCLKGAFTEPHSVSWRSLVLRPCCQWVSLDATASLHLRT